MDWGFVWLMFVMKIPLLALLWIVWWSIRSQPEPAEDELVDGGEGWPRHPRPRRPGPPRRGPHADSPLRPPLRVRSGVRRAGDRTAVPARHP